MPASDAAAEVATSAAPVDVARASLPVVAVATPSHRSDWPAAIGRANGSVSPAQRPTHRQREEGTDGLMGSLPFGIPGDTPYPAAERHDRFVTDDVLDLATGTPRPGSFRFFGGLGPYAEPAAS